MKRAVKRAVRQEAGTDAVDHVEAVKVERVQEWHKHKRKADAVDSGDAAKVSLRQEWHKHRRF